MIVGKLIEKSEEESLGGRLGYNAATDQFEDLVAAGVIDPVKVRGRAADPPSVRILSSPQGSSILPSLGLPRCTKASMQL